MVTSKKRTVEIDVVVDDKIAKTKLKGVGDEATKSAKGFASLSGGMKGAAVAAGAFVATNIVNFLGDAVNNALEDASAQEQLALAVRNATDATDAEVDAVAGYIDKTQAATGITDDQLRPALANLVRATGDVTEAQDLMSIAMDIATARGLPLEAVTLAIAKAAQGNIGALGRMGLKTRDAAGDFVTFDEAMANAAETFGGATDTFANSAEGKMARVKIAFDEAAEGVGAAVLPIIEGIADIFTNLEEAGDQNFLDAVLTDVKALGNEVDNRRENPGIQLMIDSFQSLGDMVGLYTEPTTSEMFDVLSSAPIKVDPATGAIEGLTDETEDLGDETKEATTALQKFEDQILSQTNPMYALVSAANDVAEAELGVTAAADEFTVNSPEYTAAVLDLAKKNDALTAAQLKVAEQSGFTRAEFERHLLGMGNLTDAQIQRILNEFSRVQAFRFSDKVLNLIPILRGTAAARRALNDQVGNRLPGLAAGGHLRRGEAAIVGEEGPQVFIPDAAGSVVANGQSSSGLAGSVVINVRGSVITERELVDVVRSAFVKDNRTRASLGMSFQLLQLSGDAIAWTPDSANLSITNNLDLRIRCMMDRWMPAGTTSPEAGQTFIDKRQGGDEWQFRTDNTTGRLQLIWFDGAGVGYFPTATADTPIADGQTAWVRVRKSGANCNFYYSLDDTNDHTAVSWTAVGGTVTTNSGAIRANVSTHVVIGGQGLGRGIGLRGFVYTVAILDDTTVRADPRFYLSTEWTIGEDTGDTASDGVNTWTLSGGAKIIGNNFGLSDVYVSVESAFGSGPFDNVPFWSDLTTDAQVISFDRGRMYELDRMDAGSATIELENDHGRYNPNNTASPYYPNVKPNAPIRVRAVYGGVIYPLWRGFVDRWPVSFPGNAVSLVNVECSDLFKLLAKASASVPGRSTIVEALSPTAWWRFSDTADSVGVHELTFFGGATAGGAGGVWAGDLATSFDGTDDYATVELESDIAFEASDFTVEVWVKVDNAETGVIISSGDTGEHNWELIYYAVNNTFRFDPSSVENQGITIIGGVVIGDWYHLVVTVDVITGRRIKGYVNGNLVLNTTRNYVPSPASSQVEIGRRVGEGTLYFEGDISEIVLYDRALTDAEIASLHDAQVEGFETQRTDERIAFVLEDSEVGLGAVGMVTDLDVGATMMSGINSPTDVSALEAIQQAADTERGAVFVAAGGEVRFQSRHYRLLEQTTPITTLDQTEYLTIEMAIDDDLLANDIRVTPGGGSAAIAQDSASITEHGRATLELTIYPDNLDEATDTAAHLLTIYAQPQLRLSELPIEMVETSPWAIILDAELSDRYRVTAPLVGDDLDVEAFLELISHEISLARWDVSWQLSPAGQDATAFWLLGVGGSSELDDTTLLAY